MSKSTTDTFSSLLGLAGKGIGLGFVLDQLKKINPKLATFAKGAGAAGFAADQILSFLGNQFGSEEDETSGPLNPQEAASKAQRKQETAPDRVAKQAATLAATAAGGLGALGRGAAAASQILPATQKVLTNQAPAAGKVLQGEVVPPTAPPGSGLNAQAIKQQAEQMQPSPDEQAQAPQAPTGAANPVQSFIAQHPQLGAFLDQQMKQGALPEEAALAAKTSKRFRNDVNAIEQQVGQDFVSLVKQLFSFDQAKEKVEVGDDVILGELAKLMKM